MKPAHGFCECGCGERTTIARATNARTGAIKGQPVRFIHGHHNRLRQGSVGPVTATRSRQIAPDAKTIAAVALYRATRAERAPVLAAQQAARLARVKAAVEAADARAEALRHAGRPKRRSLPPLAVGRKIDAWLASMPEYKG